MAFIPSQARQPNARTYHQNSLATQPPARSTQNTAYSTIPLGSIDLAELESSININGLRIETGNHTLAMQLPPQDRRMGRVSVALRGNERQGYDLHIRPCASPNITEHDSLEGQGNTGFTLEFSDGRIFIPEDQAHKLGNLLKDITPSSAQADNASGMIALSATTLQTFNDYQQLCQSTPPNSMAIRPLNVFKLLALADFFDNEQAITSCKQWLFKNIDSHLASTNKPLLQQRLNALTKLPHTLWEDYDITEHNQVKKMPGLLKQLLIMAFPKTPLNNYEIESDNEITINQIYREFKSQAQRVNPDEAPLIRMPRVQSKYLDARSELLRSMSTNATDALEDLLSRSDNHERHGLFQDFKARHSLYDTYDDLPRSVKQGNTLCDGIESALAKPPTLTANYQCLSTLLSAVTRECGPTVLRDTLNSPRGKSLLQIIASTNDTAALKLLIAAGAPARSTGCLSTFAQYDNAEAIRILLQHGANPNEEIAINKAITHNSTAVLATLIDAGAQLSGNLYRKCDSPINMAAKSGNIAIINTLLAAGAHPEGIHERHATEDQPVYHSINRRIYTTIERVHVTHQETPLLIALLHGQSEAASHLMSLGVDPRQTHENRDIVAAAILGDCASGLDTHCVDALMRADPTLIPQTEPQDAARFLRQAARAEHHALLELLQTFPVFTSKTVTRNIGFSGKTAHKIYKESTAPRKDILQKLSPRKLPPWKLSPQGGWKAKFIGRR